MATEYLCDGCGERYLTKSGKLTEVTIKFNELSSDMYENPNDINMDLCTRCLGSFQRSVKSLKEDRVSVG